MWEYVVAGALGAAIGVLADRLILFVAKKKEIDFELALSKAFGSYVFVDSFDISDVLDWLSPKKDLLDNGAKAIIMKADAAELKKRLNGFNESGKAKSTLVLAIIDKEGTLLESALIRFKSLGDNLQVELDKGQGAFIVGA